MMHKYLLSSYSICMLCIVQSAKREKKYLGYFSLKERLWLKFNFFFLSFFTKERKCSCLESSAWDQQPWSSIKFHADPTSEDHHPPSALQQSSCRLWYQHCGTGWGYQWDKLCKTCLLAQQGPAGSARHLLLHHRLGTHGQQK